jgi:peptidoglycan/xylan/chitin deacetylase (PgdA/CDA1 family)
MRIKQNCLAPISGIFTFIILIASSCIQNNQTGSTKYKNNKDSAFIKKDTVKKDTIEYSELKKKITTEFKNPDPGQFGEFIKGVKVKIDTKEKLTALTFDACGGKGSGYNAALIRYLRKEKIPATLFITGIWIDANKNTFAELAADTLFEIENHGLKHRLCSANGASVYGISGTKNVGEVVDEMELNARKIDQLTGTRPIFFRSATAYTDEACVKIAAKLNMQIVSYSVLSGDAIPNTPANIIAENIINHVKAGSIVIMHFNHPSWKEKDALELIIPKLRKKGFKFVKLKDYMLTGN